MNLKNNAQCIMTETNFTAQTGTNIMILTLRPKRFLPGKDTGYFCECL